jgi:hypothetical protein
MNHSKPIVSVFILFALAIIGVRVQAQQSNRASDRQVSGILQRLERSSGRFRGSLNTALVDAQIDETRAQNNINSFEPDFENEVNQFRNGRLSLCSGQR